MYSFFFDVLAFSEVLEVSFLEYSHLHSEKDLFMLCQENCDHLD